MPQGKKKASHGNGGVQAAVVEPFSTAPAAVAPMLPLLDERHIYLVHFDLLPVKYKQRIFAIPVVLNLAIALFLCWRLYRITPTYFALLLSMLGHSTSATVNVHSRSGLQLAGLVGKRTAKFALDFFLFRLIGPWPISFFLERPHSPVTWRARLGFRDAELVVRVSRRWGAEELLESRTKGVDNAFFQVRIAPAVESERVRAKSGYLLTDKYWDLDYGVMVNATELIDGKKLALTRTQIYVLVHHHKSGWLAWLVRPADEQGTAADEKDGDDGDVKRQFERVRARLAAQGKEDLFYRWVELVQYEAGKPDSSPQERRSRVQKLSTQFFDENGVDASELASLIAS